MTTDLLIEETLTERCKRLEHFETPEWAVKAILRREILTQVVIDPCCGTGILSKAAKEAGHLVFATDIHDWGYSDFDYQIITDFLNPSEQFLNMLRSKPRDDAFGDFSVLINPPFSLAVPFVEKSFELGARKVVCFQRFAWWESQGRRSFWEKHPPNRVYICGDRANCWRHDIPEDQRGSSSPTAHAWFVWEQGHPGGTQLGHIWKEDAA